MSAPLMLYDTGNPWTAVASFFSQSILPVFTCGTAAVMLANISCIWPASKSVTAAGPRAVVDHHLHAQRFTHALRHDTRDDIDTAAWRGRDNQTDGTHGIALCPGKHGQEYTNHQNSQFNH